MSMANLFGVILVGLGIWSAGRGVLTWLRFSGGGWPWPGRGEALVETIVGFLGDFSGKGGNRHPYPAASIALGVCLVVCALGSILNGVWAHADILWFVGVALLVLALAIGIAQPHFLHPRWYHRLEDRYGAEGMKHLRQAALQVGEQRWLAVCSSDESFDRWAEQVMSESPAG